MISAGQNPGLSFDRSVQNKEEKQYRIMFFGLGSIGTRLARIIRDNFNYVVFAFRSTMGNSNNFGIDEIYNEDDIEHIAPDVAFITNPTSMHMDTALACARRGMHLFIEKPLSNRKDHLNILIEAVRSNKLLTYIGCNLRFDPIIEYLKKNLPVERILWARAVSSSYLPEWRPEQDYRTSYSARKDMGGGVLLDLIHEPDYCHWLFGRIDRIEGTAGKLSNLEIETEDSADMTLFHTTGIETSVHLDYFSRDRKRVIEIFGDNFRIEADLINRTLITIHGDHENHIQFAPANRDDTYMAELDYFFTCLDRNEKPMNDIDEHLSVLNPILQFKEKAGL